MAYGLVGITHQRIGDTACQEVRKQSKAHVDAIIFLVDQANVETGRMPLANRHEGLFAVALQAKRAHQIIASPIRNDPEGDVGQQPMLRQR